MKFHQLETGFVTHGQNIAPGPRSIAAGPRVATLPSGELVVSCMLTSKLATNDFLPVLFRSSDQGRTWISQGPVWPSLGDAWSIFASVSRDAAGRLYLFGSRTPIERQGESFWKESTQGLKQNELIWAESADGGQTWTDPEPVALPMPGSAEAPGALCVTRTGRWVGPYSPCNTFDPAVVVDRRQVVVVQSDDHGRSWGHASMMRFPNDSSGAAEAWVVELADGRLLGTCWHLGEGGDERANAYALSTDGGSTWGPTRSTGILGQSTGLAALPDGRALFIYNQRKHGEIGVWLALVRPTEESFGVEANEVVWRAQTASRSDTSGELADWDDFSFGEPAIALLADGTLMVVLWCLQPDARGVAYVRLKMTE